MVVWQYADFTLTIKIKSEWEWDIWTLFCNKECVGNKWTLFLLPSVFKGIYGWFSYWVLCMGIYGPFLYWECVLEYMDHIIAEDFTLGYMNLIFGEGCVWGIYGWFPYWRVHDTIWNSSLWRSVYMRCMMPIWSWFLLWIVCRYGECWLAFVIDLVHLQI